MLRATVCCLALVGFTTTAWAGELDRETPPGNGNLTAKANSAPKPAASEMDREAPQQSHYWHGGWGYRPHFGWGGYYPAAFSYGRFGYGGFGYAAGFYPYRSFGYGGWGYPVTYGGFGYGWGYPVGYGWYW